MLLAMANALVVSQDAILAKPTPRTSPPPRGRFLT